MRSAAGASAAELSAAELSAAELEATTGLEPTAGSSDPGATDGEDEPQAAATSATPRASAGRTVREVMGRRAPSGWCAASMARRPFENPERRRYVNSDA